MKFIAWCRAAMSMPWGVRWCWRPGDRAVRPWSGRRWRPSSACHRICGVMCTESSTAPMPPRPPTPTPCHPPASGTTPSPRHWTCASRRRCRCPRRRRRTACASSRGRGGRGGPLHARVGNVGRPTFRPIYSPRSSHRVRPAAIHGPNTGFVLSHIASLVGPVPA
jgi:hypothetical protein